MTSASMSTITVRSFAVAVVPALDAPTTAILGHGNCRGEERPPHVDKASPALVHAKDRMVGQGYAVQAGQPLDLDESPRVVHRSSVVNICIMSMFSLGIPWPGQVSEAGSTMTGRPAAGRPPGLVSEARSPCPGRVSSWGPSDLTDGS
jgi:hypothetical protein